MKFEKALLFNETEVKIMTQFREEVIDSMCEILEGHCESCPFNEACKNIGEFLDDAIADRYWCVPTKGE